MKKIMFNDRFGLTQAVLDGRKTMTRRIMKVPKKFMGEEDLTLEYHQRLTENKHFYDCVVCDADGYELGQMPLPYEVGDVVAIAQSYKDAGYEPGRNIPLKKHGGLQVRADSLAGWTNKMFVKPELMPYRVQFYGIKFEHLQDISDEDCLREGIYEFHPYIDRNPNDKLKSYRFIDKKSKYGYYQLSPARDCFAVLIDKVCGNGTWESNPWVCAYEFKLV